LSVCFGNGDDVPVAEYYFKAFHGLRSRVLPQHYCWGRAQYKRKKRARARYIIDSKVDVNVNVPKP